MGTGQMGKEGFNTLWAGAGDEIELARGFGNSFLVCVGQLALWDPFMQGRTGHRRVPDTKALPCSELAVEEDRQRDRSTVLGLLKASRAHPRLAPSFSDSTSQSELKR